MPEKISMEIRRDRTGFPLIWVDEIRAWMHFFPLTKIQFEFFLADQSDPHFSEETYRQIQDGNPRLGPDEMDAGNYWQAFLTGILPHEAEKFAAWCGEGYRLPEAGEWLAAYRHLAGVKAPAIDWGKRLLDLSGRTRTLLERLDQSSASLHPGGPAGRTLAERMFLRLGVVEWVRDNESPPNWGGFGDPHPSFVGLLSSLESGEPVEPRHPETERVEYFGLRLLCADPPGERTP